MQNVRDLSNWEHVILAHQYKFGEKIAQVNISSVFAVEFYDNDQKWVLGQRFVYLVMGHIKYLTPTENLMIYVCKFCVNTKNDFSD